jgi:hypothetical protein
MYIFIKGWDVGTWYFVFNVYVFGATIQGSSNETEIFHIMWLYKYNMSDCFFTFIRASHMCASTAIYTLFGHVHCFIQIH